MRRRADESRKEQGVREPPGAGREGLDPAHATPPRPAWASSSRAETSRREGMGSGATRTCGQTPSSPLDNHAALGK